MSKTFIEPVPPAQPPQVDEQHPSFQRYAISGPAMGSRFSAVFYAEACIEAERIGTALVDAVATVEAEMSTYRPDSALMRLNAHPVGTWFDAPAALFSVLERALAIEKDTDGAFDIGVGDLVAAAGFGAHAQEPDPLRLAALAATKRVPTRQKLELDPGNRRVRKHLPVVLDLSGIAKGFGVDRLAETLQFRGVARHLVGIDGEMRAGKGKPEAGGGQVPWTIAVESPEPGARAAARLVGLEELAIATSGDYRHAHDLGKSRISHVMDPRSGTPLDNTVASVTVIASTCMDADALASGLMVLGPGAGPQRAQELCVPAVFMIRDVGGGCTELLVGQNWHDTDPVARPVFGLQGGST